jgi:phosphoglycolate phosphatase-like HAD superfamily hydrolase
MQNHVKRKNLVIFDMDGVLIDVSKSYREAVRQTATLFFNSAKASERLPKPLFPLSDLACLKQSGGLNNDWDLTCLVISLLFEMLPSTPPAIPKRRRDADSWQTYIQTIQNTDVTLLAQYLKAHSYPLTALLADKGKQINAFIGSLYVGDVGRGNIIKQIFQEIYLGPKLFKATYCLDARVWHDEGLIHSETVLFDPEILEQLAQDNILAIATGRPASEAAYPLDHFDLRKYFVMVSTLDDCLKAERTIFERERRTVSLSKPSPYMLDVIAHSFFSKNCVRDEAGQFYYIGDMPDDMAAASRASVDFIGVGAIFSTPDKHRLKAELERSGADYIIEKADELTKIIEAE